MYSHILVLNNSEMLSKLIKYSNISNIFEHGKLKIAHLQVFLSIVLGFKLYLKINSALDIVCQK